MPLLRYLRDQQVRAEHEDWFRKAAATGIALNAGRNGKLLLNVAPCERVG